MITNELRDLLAKATTHAQRFQDGEDHTVAAALLTKSGKHVLGLNAHHFLGGPCGEISALANHAASYPEDPIQAVVAVYGPTGQIMVLLQLGAGAKKAPFLLCDQRYVPVLSGRLEYPANNHCIRIRVTIGKHRALPLPQ